MHREELLARRLERALQVTHARLRAFRAMHPRVTFGALGFVGGLERRDSVVRRPHLICHLADNLRERFEHRVPLLVQQRGRLSVGLAVAAGF